MVNCAIVNAHIIYKVASRRVMQPKKFQQKHFRLELVRNLIAGFSNRKRKTVDNYSSDGVIDQENIKGHI